MKEKAPNVTASKAKQSQVVTIDASGIFYRDLNAKLRQLVLNGTRKIALHNVYGQRYIGTDLDEPAEIEIFGTPGNDLGAFTMNSGEIIVHGHAGDIIGLSARGGKIFIQDSVGYRAGIHMKEYQDRKPMIVIGGTAQDFFGEYMAGGILVLLGLNLKEGEYHKASFIGTGMHGGVIYMRGNVQDFQLGKEVGVAELEEKDDSILKELVGEFAHHFGYDAEEILKHKFTKLFPLYLRPYGRLYAY